MSSGSGSGSSSSSWPVREGEELEDIWAKAIKAADDLYTLRDTYFPPNPCDKVSKLQSQSDLCLNLLASIPIGGCLLPLSRINFEMGLENFNDPFVFEHRISSYLFDMEQRKSPKQRATYEYLRGKVLDAVPEYSKEAEDHLSKAVKLNPSLADAWLCLGNCIWKKGDLPSAKNCFNLALSKGPNKKILCAENQAQIIEESIQHAKDAITLDVKDGNSWYNLGNACLTSFFVTGAWDHSKLLQSLKAYQNAEKDERMKSNPDLYFNCATANQYLENYERALGGFEAAASKDPSLNASEEVQKMVNLLDKLENLLRGQARAKRLASLASSLATVNCKLPDSFVFLLNGPLQATVDQLLEGLNRAVALVGKVLFFVKQENDIPLYYLVCDSNQICFVLSVYGMRNDAIKEGDQLTLLEPYYHYVDFSWKEKVKVFACSSGGGGDEKGHWLENGYIKGSRPEEI
ncbi:unnamed protein product [Dovyalis caffra]|uniref:Tetratricopeptide repeat protein 5 OB fold domain-containing protein n=1 Tax=Dovyalis caffra TaxID=77055 RepID=A0AAV1R0Y0_9ROSI|nr:unnamed protein product [Dovyalis caffra]